MFWEVSRASEGSLVLTVFRTLQSCHRLLIDFRKAGRD